jgi:hypothetical protein
LHPRTGTPPNPGWFAPTDGGSADGPRIRVAENQSDARRSDAAPGDEWVRLPPREGRIDELADFLEWFANAKPADEKAIRREIKRYFYNAGDRIGGDRLTHALRNVIDPGVDRETRQEILNDIEDLSRSDPTIVGQYENLFYLIFSFLLPGSPRKIPREAPESPAIPKDGTVESSSAEATTAVESALKDKPSEVWTYGWGRRGQEIHKVFSDGSLPPGFPTIDNFTDGIATSIKSIDLRAAVYQNAARLTSRLQKYVAYVADYEGGRYAGKTVLNDEITGRAVNLVVPKGSMTEEQLITIERIRAWARMSNSRPVDLIITEY